MSGPTTPASACPLAAPQVAIATAMASSEVVARRGERQRGGAGIAQSQGRAQHHSTTPHEREVDEQRQRDANDVERLVDDLIALQGEEGSRW